MRLSASTFSSKVAARLRDAGLAVVCPCCGGHFRGFVPRVDRPAAVCPRCGALERHRALALWLRRHRRSVLPRGAHVLHLAPEPSLRRWVERQPGVRYLAGDLSPAPGDEQLDVTALTLADGVCDLILCSHVLEHVPDDARALGELARVLAPSGTLLLQQPVDVSRASTYEDPSVVEASARERAFGQADHVRVYGRDFERRLAAAGLRVDVARFPESVSERSARRHGLRSHGPETVRAEDVYVCARD